MEKAATKKQQAMYNYRFTIVSCSVTVLSDILCYADGDPKMIVSISMFPFHS